MITSLSVSVKATLGQDRVSPFPRHSQQQFSAKDLKVTSPFGRRWSKTILARHKHWWLLSKAHFLHDWDMNKDEQWLFIKILLMLCYDHIMPPMPPIPPMPPPPIGGISFFSGISVITTSAVVNSEATPAASTNDVRTT